MFDIIFILLGFGLMVKGADFFVVGSSGIAKSLRVSSLIIGLTIIAFGTSAPEAAVSITSAIQLKNTMSLGNIIGSNLFNLLFILGIAAIITPISVKSSMIKREIPFAILSSLVLLIFYFLRGAWIDRLEGLIYVALFFLFMYIILKYAKSEKELEIKLKFKFKTYIGLTIIGLIMIIMGGILTTQGAVGLAIRLGMSELLVGLLILAVGTSLPELVTSVVAAIKKENDIAIGNIIGSNIFNVFFILGISTIISPVSNTKTTLVDISLLLFFSVVTYIFAITGRSIKRGEGIILVLSYIGYIVFIILRN